MATATSAEKKDWRTDVDFLVTSRRRLGVSQQELARMAGVTRAWLSLIETSQIRLTPKNSFPLWSALAAVEADYRREVPLTTLLEAQ